MTRPEMDVRFCSSCVYLDPTWGEKQKLKEANDKYWREVESLLDPENHS